MAGNHSKETVAGYSEFDNGNLAVTTVTPMKTSLGIVGLFYFGYFVIISTRPTSTEWLLTRNQIGRTGFHVKKENKKFTIVCSRSPENLEFDHFTFLSCRGRQRNVLIKFKMHVQSDCFSTLNLFLCGRCGCLSLWLFKFPNDLTTTEMEYFL